MNFFQVWFTGYVNPPRMVAALAQKPAPHWGLYGQGLRALMDALLLYLPLALLDKSPSTPSYLTFIPTKDYFSALVFLAPAVLMTQWLLLSVALHVILRMLDRPSDVDQILNITGMSALVVGAFLVAWDWVWILMEWRNPVGLGLSHLLLDGWGIFITVLGLNIIVGISVRLALVLNGLWLVLGLPVAILFMRAPV